MSKNDTGKLFLGIDGGQSHTEALIADEAGIILGIGPGGPLNHGNLADGRQRLTRAIQQSVGQALINSGLKSLENTEFYSGHCGLTGGADFKQDIVRNLIKAKHLTIGHDALTALYGASAGQPGIVVIAGTGSIVFGINAGGETARAGGLGFIFSDEGSGFWLAVETIKLAIKEQDGILPGSSLHRLVLDFFQVGEIRDLTNKIYNDKISRDELAKFAETIAAKASSGNKSLRHLLKSGAQYLVENVRGASTKLKFYEPFHVSVVGGVFRSALMKKYFCDALEIKISNAVFIEPQFGPAVGALLLAYKNSNLEITGEILTNLRESYDRQNTAR